MGGRCCSSCTACIVGSVLREARTTPLCQKLVVLYTAVNLQRLVQHNSVIVKRLHGLHAARMIIFNGWEFTVYSLAKRVLGSLGIAEAT